ncbi:hypothetical protein J4423_02735 [Candidatus Pacearchaeota archaeon]|nr:hypothetical protein [Candidatus Pacearchaeota archaeon]
MKNFERTILYTVLISLITIGFVTVVQLKGQQDISSNASYLDPITIDVLAFLASFFLIFEGAYRIWEHKNDRYRKQFTRSLRIAFGVAILTTHIIQTMFKVNGFSFPI